MAEVNSLEVLIQANADQFRRELNDVNKRLGDFGNGAKGVGKSLNSLSLSTAAVGVAVGVMAAKIVKATATAIKASTNLAMEAIESENLVAITFGRMTSDITEWSNNLESALGLNAYYLRKNAGVYYNMASSLGLASNNALVLSKNVVSLAEDMASFYNLSEEEAFNKIRSGLTGITLPLKELGIVVNDAYVKTVAYKYGIAALGTELSEGQKLVARYYAILDQTKNAHGDLARTLDTPLNQMRIFKARVQALGISLGNLLIPMINAVLPYIQAFILLVTKAVRALSNLLGIMGVKPSAGMEETGAALESIGDAAGGSAGQVAKLKKELLGLAAFDEMNELEAPEGEGGGGGGGVSGGIADFPIEEYDMGLGSMSKKVDEIIAKFNEFRNIVKGVFEDMFNSDMFQQYVGLWGKMWEDIVIEAEIWGPIIWGSISKLFGSIWKDAIKPALGIIKDIWMGLLDEIGIAWDNHGVGILNRIGEFVNNVIGLFQSIWDNVLAPIIKPFLEMLKKVWEETFRPMLATVLDFVGKLIKAALDIFNKFIYPIVTWLLERLKPVFTFIGQWIANVIGGILTTFGNLLSGVFRILGGLIDFIAGVFTGDWKRVWEGVKNVFGGIVDTLVALFRIPLNGIITGINAFISGLNKIKIPEWVPAVGGKGFNIQPMRYLATGGVIESPTVAMLGEAGKEVVLPLESNTEWMDKLVDKIGGGSPIQLVVNVGNEKIAEKVIEYANDKSMRSGSLVFNI